MRQLMSLKASTDDISLRVNAEINLKCTPGVHVNNGSSSSTLDLKVQQINKRFNPVVNLECCHVEPFCFATYADVRLGRSVPVRIIQAVLTVPLPLGPVTFTSTWYRLPYLSSGQSTELKPPACPGGHPKCSTYGHPNCSIRPGVT